MLIYLYLLIIYLFDILLFKLRWALALTVVEPHKSFCDTTSPWLRQAR